MVINIEDTGHSCIKALIEGMKYVRSIHSAYSEKKWCKLATLIILMLGMIAVVFLVKSMLVGYIATWLTGTWGLPLPISKVAASCVGKWFTAQLGDILKYWVLKIDK